MRFQPGSWYSASAMNISFLMTIFIYCLLIYTTSFLWRFCVSVGNWSGRKWILLGSFQSNLSIQLSSTSLSLNPNSKDSGCLTLLYVLEAMTLYDQWAALTFYHLWPSKNFYDLLSPSLTYHDLQRPTMIFYDLL